MDKITIITTNTDFKGHVFKDKLTREDVASLEEYLQFFEDALKLFGFELDGKLTIEEKE